jgi:hypothetical protein
MSSLSERHRRMPVDSRPHKAPFSPSTLPSFVRATLLLHRAFLVGSGAEWFLTQLTPQPRDFDVLVDPHEYQDACKMLTGVDVRINSFGGTTVIGPPAIDVIPMDLGEYVKRCSGNIAVSLMPYRIIRW